ncbi:hypothetical protein [Actinacidiphila epipremni]|uniref:Uncharacterized protein n=1 Tax=Actinacidiphila epipremni TaxID=2053013 RepID=A0ABX0ZNV4_9ACTN|nr:hypothetical protein [Actinacidiphila epipremni]NJP45590.1 hypothetical protein [Actinacidiphila epipremni]
MPTPSSPPAGDPPPVPGRRPYGSVRLAAPVPAAPAPRRAAPGPWPYGSLRLPPLSVSALRAGRRRAR